MLQCVAVCCGVLQCVVAACARLLGHRGIYVCMHLCIIYVILEQLYTYTHVYMYICIFIWKSKMNNYIHIHMYTCTYVYLFGNQR